MERKLIPVYGSTGEYEDYRQWVVGLFHIKQSAEAAAKLLNAKAESLGVSTNACTPEQQEDAEKLLREAGDPSGYVSYTGIKYRVGEPLFQYVDFADFRMTAGRHATR